MSKAKDYIIEHTSVLKESNGKEYFKWLTPEQTKSAVEIARNEIYEWLKENASNYMDSQSTIFGTIKVFNTFNLISDLKQAMKDET